MEPMVDWEMVCRLKCVCENREVVVGCWALLKGGPKLRPAKFTPAVVMSVSTLEYSGSEAPASLVCKSVYSGALCEVIFSVAAKLQRDPKGNWWSQVVPLLLPPSQSAHYFFGLSQSLQKSHTLLNFSLLQVKLFHC